MATNPKSVFVGNIPFSLSEEQIIQILSNAGQVIRFRLISNPETGKPRGYGFADFSDADAAASAVRNLNGHEIQGRKIRVDWPTEKDQPGQEQMGQPQHIDIPPPQPTAAAPGLPPLPPGTDLPPNLKATDAISQTLNTLPPPQLLDVLTQMKAMAISEPQRAAEILKAAPQLSYAIFQALILMNLVDPKILAQVVEQATAAANPAPQQIHMPPQPVPTPQQYQYPPQPQQQQVPQQQQFRPPPQQYPPPQQMQQPPPMQQQQQQQMNPDHNALLQQVLQMDQRTIDSLPPHERAQIMQIRASVGQYR